MLLASGFLGLAWAWWQFSTTRPPYSEQMYPALVWVLFATPAALLVGWVLARPRERWMALLICFCIYFLTPFVAARYESCSMEGGFNLIACFTRTQEARELANASGHRLYFQAVLLIHAIAVLAVALQRARKRSTIPHTPVAPMPTHNQPRP